MKILFALLFIFSTLLASPRELAIKFNLVAGKKAIIQWERVFNDKKKMKKYKIDQLSKKQQELLKTYLLDHAADSDHPTVSGG